MKVSTLGFLLLAVTVATAPALRAEQTITSEQYIAALEDLRSRVEAAGADPKAIGGIATTLPRVWSVEVEGRRYEVAARALRADLLALSRAPASASDEADRAQGILSRLSLMTKEARALAETPATDAGEARAKLEAILARPEFAASERGWVGDLVYRINRWLADLFGPWRVRFGSGVLTEAVAWIAVAALFSVVAVWVLRALSRTSPPLRLRVDTVGAGAEDPRRWIAEAATAAAEGRYRDAVRCAYWAAIVRMAETGAWDLDRTRTHREYLKLLPATHALRAPLESVTGRFERIWYGAREATAEDFGGMTANLETLGCSLPSRRGTAGS